MERFTKFFTSLGGVLASLATMIGGAAALYVAFGGECDKSSPNPNSATCGQRRRTLRSRTGGSRRRKCVGIQAASDQARPASDDAAGQVSYMQQSIQISSSMAAEMRALEEPDAIADDVGRLLDSLDEQVQLSVAFLDA